MLAICASLRTNPGRSLRLRRAAAATFLAKLAGVATGCGSGADAAGAALGVGAVCSADATCTGACAIGASATFACGDAETTCTGAADACGTIGVGLRSAACASASGELLVAATGIDVGTLEASSKSCGKRSATICAAESSLL